MTIPLQVSFPGTGTLALAGSGEYLPGMELVDQFLMASLQVPAHVVCLPTAAGTEGEDRLHYWDDLGLAHFSGMGAASVQALDIIDRAGANDPELIRPIKKANFVYLSGGKPTFLYKCLHETAALQAIQDVLKRGGVLAGCSAGAMIFGERIPDLKISAGFTHPGFGFLPGAFIVPHYDEIPAIIQAGLSKLAGTLTMVGIDGYTALVCTQSGCRVIGKSAVTITQNHKTEKYYQE